MSFIDHLNWRYAVKKYDTAKKVSTEDLDKLKEAIRLSPSAYGLQPYKVLIIENAELRETLKGAAYGQTQVSDASHFFVFANILDFGNSEIDSYINNISKIREIPVEGLEGFSTMMKSSISVAPEDWRNNWTAKQAYLALGNFLHAASSLHIDASPMEGFDAEKFNEILGLKERGLNAAVIAAIGYRHEEDATQHYKKVRKSNEELFITL